MIKKGDSSCTKFGETVEVFIAGDESMDLYKLYWSK
jgi:hypothetical protein